MMAVIQHKYRRHVELRQQILNQLAQMDHIKERLKTAAAGTSIPKHGGEDVLEKASDSRYTSDAYLLLPYIEQAQALARQQKSMVQEKSHTNGILAKQQEDTRQILDRVAEESQLLSRYQAANVPSKSHSSFEDATSQFDKLRIMEQVQPWIYAADSAKLATLEEVAESVELGMGSVDEARAHLEQICKLLNIPVPREGDVATPKDSGEGNEKTSISPRKGQTKKDDDDCVKTIWDVLDGNLGSINE
jgi:hypothetical protein